MSRGVRDLRDLICVSRLTFNESEEDEAFSDNDKGISKEASSLSLSSGPSDSNPSTPVVAAPNARVVSPDSGFVTNGSPGVGPFGTLTASSDSLGNGDGFFLTGTTESLSEAKAPPAGKAKFVSSQKKKKRKKGAIPLEPARRELPKSAPLPPVQSIPGAEVVNEHELDSAKPSYQRVQSAQPNKQRTGSRINFDDMLIVMDATIVANWLTRANTSMQELSKFCNKGDNFVQFAHFWLSDFPDVQKKDIFSMEHDILMDEIALAFAVGRENGKIVRRDILDMVGAIFREYPVKIMGAKGPHLFIDYLDILTSEKHAQYKKLLSDVRCSTSNRQYAQWLLATRSFALVNVWSSVVNFYKNLVGEFSTQGMPILELCSTKESVPHRRMLQAIRLGYIDVIHYLIVNGHVNPTWSDSHRRSLVFTAVMHNQPSVVKYLLTRVHPVIEINQKADTGNTALHAASNTGNLAMVEMLCGCDRIDVNCVNPQCENATPLHLAVMHGHEKIAECLLNHGADPHLKMGNTTVIDLAQDFSHTDILELLKEK